MCTLVAIHRRIPGAPLVVAANRDEYLDRPAEGPAVRVGEAGPVLMPRDLRAGGTWLGLSARGLFAAVTNRPCADPDPARRSRGHVVPEALAAGSAREAAERFERLPRRAYNPFNAFVADAHQAFAMIYDDAPGVKELAPGAHVVGNGDPDSRAHPKQARVLERAEAAAELDRDDVLPALAALCAEHTPGPASLADTCIHLEGYGTRSSLLLLLAEDPALRRMSWADGPPCSHEYDDSTPLLHELSQRARYGAGEHATRKAS